jgi:hypothetical protein
LHDRDLLEPLDGLRRSENALRRVGGDLGSLAELAGREELVKLLNVQVLGPW